MPAGVPPTIPAPRESARRFKGLRCLALRANGAQEVSARTRSTSASASAFSVALISEA
jgi:hypothetical protein